MLEMARRVHPNDENVMNAIAHLSASRYAHARNTEASDLEGGYSLRPVSKAILPMVIEAYSEDPESAKAALPWLRSDENITRQLADMLHDLNISRARTVSTFGRFMMMKTPSSD